jgi:glycosyltransferase involved in cell wall biosynthesis
MISSYEIELLTSYFKVDPALLLELPFMLPAINKQQKNEWNTFENKTHFISIGNFLHEPNWDAVKFLKQEIWPLIRKKLPKAELHIYGAYPSKKVTDLHNSKQGFIVKGRAESALDVMNKAKVCLAPLRFGAGQKGKLIDSMLMGTPNVTTSIGAESMHNNLPWNGEIKDNAEEIAEAAIDLYTNEEKWLKAQLNGIELIEKCFPRDKLGKYLVSSINELYNNLNQHRLNNFTGAMLMHHSLASTKFMSKWIEAKNYKPST